MTILSKCKTYLIGLSVAVAAAIGLYIKGKSDGKSLEKNKQLKGKINAVKTSKKSRAGLHNTSVVDKLHKKYRR